MRHAHIRFLPSAVLAVAGVALTIPAAVALRTQAPGRNPATRMSGTHTAQQFFGSQLTALG